MSKPFVLLVLFSCFFLTAHAFFIPDIEVVGKDPEISFLEPDYLIPGSKVKIYGKNFFASPKSANKLMINDKKVRVISASNDYIEFIVPTLSLGEAKIQIFTNYLGYQSKEATYNSPVLITYIPPVLDSVSSRSVKPNENIFLFGNFNIKNDLFCVINNKEIKVEILDSKTSQIKLPKNLLVGLFKIKLFYRKLINNAYFNSPFSSELVLYNNEFGSPAFLQISILESIFTVIDDRKTPFTIELFFNNGKKVDVTEYSNIFVDNSDVIDLNKTDFKVKQKGEAEIMAEFLWNPENIMYSDSEKIIVDIPEAPKFLEVVIDEVYPFVSSLLPQTDANMDGFAKLNDEFIELHNLTEKIFDLSMCEIFIGEKEESEVLFPENTFIDPFSYFVVFGDSAKDEKLNLSNSGSSIELICNGKTIDYTAYASGKNGDPSWQRKPNLVGFEKHPGTLFSPGTAPPAVGTNFNSPSSNNESTIGIDTIEPVGDIPQTNNITEINIIPSSLSFTDKNSQAIKIEALYENGNIVDVTSLSQYKINGNPVISIDSNGVVVPILNGTVTIDVTYEGLTNQLSVTVNIPSEVQSKQLIINEVLSAPSIDVNKDSIYKSDEDEFIEIVNISGKELDISGLIISDKTKARHTIPPGTKLQNLEPLVLFGGGSTLNFNPGIKTQIASTGSFGLNNTGDEEVSITTNDGRIIDKVLYNNLSLTGISLNREKDLEFISLKSHITITGSVGNYSPGFRVSSLKFSD